MTGRCLCSLRVVYALSCLAFVNSASALLRSKNEAPSDATRRLLKLRRSLSLCIPTNSVIVPGNGEMRDNDQGLAGQESGGKGRETCCSNPLDRPSQPSGELREYLFVVTVQRPSEQPRVLPVGHGKRKAHHHHPLLSFPLTREPFA